MPLYETAVQAIKLGAVDYIKKPIRFTSLLEMIKKILRDTEPREIPALPNLQTRNPIMQSTIKKATKLANSRLSVLILGDSGTGKELMADLLHENSSRKNMPIEKINCAAFPESLLDNELFGHEPGAFTGANEDYMGVFERAHNGTLFLDELGDMPLSIQAKILRAIQEQEIRRLGGKKTIKIDVRFIGATNKDLSEMVKKGEFRKDLFYRLNCACLKIPPLKDRIEDIPLLVRFFLNQFSEINNSEPYKISDEALSRILSYDWPGNIRELKAAINYGATVCSNRKIRLEDLPVFNETPEKPSDKTESHIRSPREQMERELIQKTLIQYSFNKKKAAEILEMSRTTLYSKMEKYGI